MSSGTDGFWKALAAGEPAGLHMGTRAAPVKNNRVRPERQALVRLVAGACGTARDADCRAHIAERRRIGVEFLTLR